MQPLVSVIVPIYKVEDYLDECLSSVVNQTYQHLEIILVDDGSPDNCPAMCDAWEQKDARVKVLHKENGGLSDARNCGIAQASGEYVFQIDSDDTIAENTIALLMSLAQEHQAQIVSTTMRDVRNTHDMRVGTGEEMFCDMLQNEWWSAWGKLVKKELLEGRLYPVGMLYEDLAHTPFVALRANHVVLLDNGMYHYRRRTDSIMGAEQGKSFVSVDLYHIVVKIIEASKDLAQQSQRLALDFATWILCEKYTLVKKSGSGNQRNEPFLNEAAAFLRKHKASILRNQKTRLRKKAKVFALLLF